MVDPNSGHAVLACTGGFTRGVWEFAYDKPIELISASDLMEMADSIDNNMAREKYIKVLDHCSNLKYEWPVSMGPSDLRPELNALSTLKTGLEHLNNLVQEREFSVATSNFPFDIAYDVEVNQLIACVFRWYSVAACDYVRTVGWLTKKGDDEQAKTYLDSVIPEVRYFRDKVGAHFSPSHPRKSDTPSSKFFAENSDLVQFQDGVFVASGLNWKYKKLTGFESEDMTWSLTRTHTELAKRYWPDVQA